MFLSYSDPLFGIIVFFIFIFIASALTYVFGLYKEKKARQEYRKLLKRFELGTLKEDDYIHLYTTYNLPLDSIILLASTFLHKGEYNKAISVYLALLKIVENRIQKEELLEILGTTYYKGGFLQRSKDIFLKILQFSPRNIHALYHLLIIYEKLNEYKRALEVIDVLIELKQVTQKEDVYIKTLEAIQDPLICFEENSIKLLALYKTEPIIQRLVAQYLLKYNKHLFWNNINIFSLKELIDLLWYLPKEDIDFNLISNNQFLEELYTAKGYINIQKSSDIFELDLMIKLESINQNRANLSFNFICTKCKKTHPVYESRCPNCNEILSLNPNMKLIKQQKFATNSFL